MSQQQPRFTIEVALLICLAVLWGSSYLWIKIAVHAIPPFTLIALRVTIAAIVLVAVAVWFGHKLPTDLRTWRMLCVQAFLNSTGAWTLLAWGQQFVDSGLAGVLNSTSPLFVLMFTLLWTRHEAVTSARVIGVLLGIGGVVAIIGFDALRGLGQQVIAQLAVLLGAVMYAGAAIYGRQKFNHLHPTATAAGTMICASACLVPLSVAVDRPWTLSPPVEAVMAAIILGVLCTGLALLLYFRLLRTLGSIGVASQSYLRAGISVVLGIVVLGEPITVVVVSGALATIAGVALINMPLAGRAHSIGTNS